MEIVLPLWMNEREPFLRAEHNVNVKAAMCRRHTENPPRPLPGSEFELHMDTGGRSLALAPPATVRAASGGFIPASPGKDRPRDLRPEIGKA